MEQSLKTKIEDLGKRAKLASKELARLSAKEKNEILSKIKSSLMDSANLIISENKKDLEKGKELGLSAGIMDRLLLDEKRIYDMANSIDDVISLEDPVGKISKMHISADGLKIGKKTVPIGVIAIIYEARPNVTLDAAILALKAGSSIILRGGKESINSNIAIANAMRNAIKNLGYNEDFVQIIDDTTRESSMILMEQKNYVDLLVPRGSASLIESVAKNSKVPVLETGVGNCHVFVDESADIDMAINIIKNAKTQRVGVCNAMESLLVHKNVPDEFYKRLQNLIDEYDIRVYGDEISREKLPAINPATEEDYGKEYLDYAFSIKVCDCLEDAIEHIYKYSTSHSEVIVTKDYENANKFLDEVDSACVYVNASSRFTDGFMFGYGAELGISTQKLHARGPVGLDELVSTKYVIYGNGQIRN